MDKNSFETYEYLPSNNSESIPEQFFVVQDDGTFLINRQVQYVTQVQDTKSVLEGTQTCTVYDVASQQFFVDVDNSTELISVSDEFILPDGGSNLYTNGYLLQPMSTSNQVDEDIVSDALKQTDHQMEEEMATETNKQTLGNNLTEITLSNEQYQMLEEKGWVLFETSKKVFVLDTLGLHDITNDNKLIQRLKSEIQVEDNLENSGSKKNEIPSSPFETVLSQNESNEQDAKKFIDANDKMQEDVAFTLADNEVKNKLQQYIICEKQNVEPILHTSENNKRTESLTSERPQRPKYGSTVKLKTNFTFKDIPNKIVLGKTSKGKKLVMKLVNSIDTEKINSCNNRHKELEAKLKSEITNYSEMVFEKSAKSLETTNTDTQLESLIQQSLDNLSDASDSVDLATANTIISQLLRVTAFKTSMIERNLIITKVIKFEDECGEIYKQSKPVMVSGRVSALEGGRWRFVHRPRMAKQLMASKDDSEMTETSETGAHLAASDDPNLWHVHVSETKRADNFVITSITLNKRHLPLKCALDIKKRQSSTVFACGACATMFQKETELKEHQETPCTDNDDMLVIDTEKINSSNVISCAIEKGKDKIYLCTLCDSKFTRLGHCQRHMKTHLNLSKQITSDNKTISNQEERNEKNSKGMYKCQMCQSSYYHPSTLSRHILARHIKVKCN